MATSATVVVSVALVGATSTTAGADNSPLPGKATDNGWLVLSKNAAVKGKADPKSTVTYYAGGTPNAWTNPLTSVTQSLFTATTPSWSTCLLGSNTLTTTTAANGQTTTTATAGYPFLSFSPAPTTGVSGATGYPGYQNGYLGVDSVVGTSDNSGQACQQVNYTEGEVLSFAPTNGTASLIPGQAGKNYFSGGGLDLQLSGNAVVMATFWHDGQMMGGAEFQSGFSAPSNAYRAGDIVSGCQAGTSNSGPQNGTLNECFWTLPNFGSGTVFPSYTNTNPGAYDWDRLDLQLVSVPDTSGKLQGLKGTMSIGGGQAFTGSYASNGGPTYFKLAQIYQGGAVCGTADSASTTVGSAGGFSNFSFQRLPDINAVGTGDCTNIKYYSALIDPSVAKLLTSNNDPNAAWQMTFALDFPDGTYAPGTGYTAPGSSTAQPTIPTLKIDFTNTGTGYQAMPFCPSNLFTYPAAGQASSWSWFDSANRYWSYNPQPKLPTLTDLTAAGMPDWNTNQAGPQYACIYATSVEEIKDATSGVSYQHWLFSTLAYGDLQVKI